jgi:CysZ protein
VIGVVECQIKEVQMEFLSGITYNIRGLGLSIKTPKLLLLGFIRFAAVILITILAASLILHYHTEILDLIWTKPESRWIVWLWHVISWLLSLILVGVSAVVSYLISQILFSVIIMDLMSRITERMTRGHEKQTEKMPLLKLFFYLVRQEIPRTIIPVVISLVLMVIGWLTPLGPVIAILASAIAITFLSWDNTDLVPARRLFPFRDRFRFLRKTLSFHLGFGLWFLVPGLNIVFLSFAPVGATLYYLDKYDAPNHIAGSEDVAPVK